MARNKIFNKIDATYIGSLVSLLGLMVSFISHDDFILLALIFIPFWLNGNLFLERYFPHVTQGFLSLIDKPFQSFSLYKNVLLFLFESAKSVPAWLFFIPLRATQFIEKSQDYVSLLEIGMIALGSVAFLQRYFEQSYLLFYPMVWIVCIGYQLIRTWVLNRLK